MFYSISSGTSSLRSYRGVTQRPEGCVFFFKNNICFYFRGSKGHAVTYLGTSPKTPYSSSTQNFPSTISYSSRRQKLQYEQRI
jgi:hypothetical protein